MNSNLFPLVALLLMLVDAATKAAAVLLLAWMATAWMSRASAARRHLVWLLAATIALLLPIASALLPAFRLPLLPAAWAAGAAGQHNMMAAETAAAPTAAAPTAAAPAAAAPAAGAWGGSGRDMPAATLARPLWTAAGEDAPMPRGRRRAVPAAEAAPLARSPAIPSSANAAAGFLSRSRTLPSILLGVWLAGSSFVGCWFLIGLALVARLVRRTTALRDGPALEEVERLGKMLHLTAAVPVRVGPAVKMPLAVGVYRPKLLLPLTAVDQWPAAQRRSVLLHELAHIRRCDCGTQWLAQLACILYWFNPLTWLAAYRMRQERERACDDLVLAQGQPPVQYAQHLMLIAQALRSRPWLDVAAVPMARRSGLRQRLAAVLDAATDRRSVSRRLAIAAVAAAVALLVPLSAVHLGSRRSAARAQLAPTTKPAASARPAQPLAATTQRAPATGPTAMLDLQVLDPSGKPIKGATVFSSDKSKIKVLTDANGHVLFPVPRKTAGYFELEVRSPGCVNELVEWRHVGADPVPSTYTLRMVPTTKIGGRVVDDAGQPVAGAHVETWVEKHLPNPHERLWNMTDVRTGTDGRWTFDGAPAMDNATEVAAWDYQHANDDYYPIDAYPLRKLQDGSLTLTLQRGVPVQGVVLGPDGKPLAGAEVAWGGTMCSNRIDPQKTGADGRFAFAAKPGYQVVLTVTHKGCAPELKTVKMTDQKQELTIALAKAMPMVGRIVDEAGNPVPGAWVFPDTWRGYRSLETRVHADKNGRFTWKDAPRDAVLCDIDATDLGFTRQRLLPLTATDHEITITVHKALQVNGTVVDDVTGQPVPSFRMVLGIGFGNGQPPMWEHDRENVVPFHDGTFHYAPTWPYPQYAVRIEADGYQPAESRTFTAAEKQVTLQVRLKHGHALTAAVLQPDGRPAAGANAVLVVPGGDRFDFTGDLFMKYGRLQEFKSDAAGKLTIPPQTGKLLLVVLHDSGIAQLDQDQLASGSDIHLKPWARVQGRLMIGSQPGAGQKVSIDQVDYPHDPQQLSMFFNLKQATDASGHFSFDRVPPMRVYVGRYVERGTGAGYIGSYAQQQKLDLSPGQVANVTLGGQGRPIIGRIQIPPELTSRQDWSWGLCTLRSVLQLPTLPMPDDIKTGTPQQRRQWATAFLKTDAGKAFLAAQAKADASLREYPVVINDDGSFRVDDVEAASYTLNISADQHPPGQACSIGPSLATATYRFTVPPMPTGRDDRPMELPTIPLQLLTTINVGDAAPAFAAHTLDGKPLQLADFHGKYVLLDFWATWCGPCLEEVPSIKAVHDAFGNDPRFAMISFSLDQSADDAKKYVQKNNLAWNQVFEDGGWEAPTVKAYGVHAIPSVWLIGPDGKVIAKDLRGENIKTAVAAALGRTGG